MAKSISKEDRRVAIFVPLFVIAAVLMVRLFISSAEEEELGTVEAPSIFDLYANADINLEELQSYSLPMILDFGAEWSEPSRLMEPVLVKLNEELRGKAIIKRIDIDELEEFSSNFPINAVPTQFFYNVGGTPFIVDENIAVNFIFYEPNDDDPRALTAHEGYLDEQTILMILESMGMSIE